MRKQFVVVLVIFFTALLSCKNERKFPEVKNLSEFENTEFIPTLEHEISYDKNSVYCATLLFGWNEIRNQINSPLIISEKNLDLYLLNQSTSFFNVLESDEYNVSVDVDNDLITARAEFNKSLPFEEELQSFEDKLTFDGDKVSSFGLYISSFELYSYNSIIKIIYYKNDNNFIIKLFPKDKEHEIVLFKSAQNFNSIAEMVAEISKLEEVGKLEMGIENISWKYYFDEDDEVVIPKFSFNIETNYNTLEGKAFFTKEREMQIIEAWQRTAFVLDESGAKIESEIEFLSLDATDGEETIQKPKKMIFDKPFLVLLKRKNAENPYFGLWATNSELMVKE